ncbi:hypothetical protein NLI96_g10383 [Meripilus lineatus]|uniref:Mitochondrial escape protein 2 n=1 Tax=Meripilus lineatus TaxID=2056292 RepID=A0AAD5YEA5_9APHY|nr:hypothetical protein NLI96_g10383 [Physisporinus lineatus]
MSLSRGLTGLARNSLGVARHRTIPSSLRRVGAVGSVRTFADAAATEDSEVVQERNETADGGQEGWLFVDSVFPVRVASWDLRYYIGQLRQEALLSKVKSLVASVHTNELEVLSVEPQIKDGGVFVRFRYTGGADDHAVLESILSDIKKAAAKQGGVPSWSGFKKGDIWLVKGKPWREDLNRFASHIVKISFEGPDVHEETLYEVLRPYGRIVDLTTPTPVPAGMLRSTSVSFRNVRSAAAARNTVHGLVIRSGFSGSVTRLQTSYQVPLQAHVIRDYITSHPRIFLPVLIFLLGTLTYTIFDPMRVLMVEGKMNDWFDYRQFRIYQWIRENTIERLSFASSREDDHNHLYSIRAAWKERQEAERALVTYLSDIPSTVAFIHGPQGSGKSRLLASVLKDSNRKTLTIDINDLTKVTTESALVRGLATQTGYWPVFSFLNSVNQLIDLASVGLIGQKTGLSSSLSDQLKQILEVVGTGLARINKDRKDRDHHHQQSDEARRAEAARISERAKQGTWHDGRLDAVSGNGVMSELGVGDEWLAEKSAGEPFLSFIVSSVGGTSSGDGDSDDDDAEAIRRMRSAEELEAIGSMPVVIIKNFDSKGVGFRREELLNVLAQWAATLAENKIAHVIVISNNRENAKRLAKAFPSPKPLALVTLADADNASALTFVKQRLYDVDLGIKFSKNQTALVERLGGRASDLESLIHKVRSGLTIENAVEDIIIRGASELRKSAFGDDAEDAKGLPWAREQAWFLMKQLSKKPELPYQDILNEFPFKGDEAALRSMEHAELISIGTVNGRPSSIKPGKPIYRYVFDRLVHDNIFEATQDIAFNTSLIKYNEGIIQKCEQEIVVLKDVDAATSVWWGSRAAVDNRREYLLGKMRQAGTKVEIADRQNTQLKKVLAKGG